jgi:hypothetical protein
VSGGDDFTAANIVYQLGDLLGVPAGRRQETNDQAVAFVTKLLNRHTAAELRMVADQWERERRTKSWWYYAEDLRTEAAALEAD